MDIDVIGGMTAIVFLIAWAVRLEAKALQNERDLQRHIENQKDKSEAIWAKFDALQNTMGQMVQGLGRVEGKIDAMERTR